MIQASSIVDIFAKLNTNKSQIRSMVPALVCNMASTNGNLLSVSGSSVKDFKAYLDKASRQKSLHSVNSNLAGQDMKIRISDVSVNRKEVVKADAKRIYKSEDGEVLKKKEKHRTQSEQDMVFDCFARVLDMAPEELSKIMDMLGISKETLSDVSKIEDTAYKIAEFAGLSNGYRDVLGRILEYINSQVDALTELEGMLQGEYKENEQADNDNMFLAGATGKVDMPTCDTDAVHVLTKNSDGTEQLIEKLKVKLEALVDKSEKAPDDIFNRIAEAMRNLASARQHPAFLKLNMEEGGVSPKTASGAEVKETAPVLQDLSEGHMDTNQESGLETAYGQKEAMDKDDFAVADRTLPEGMESSSSAEGVGNLNTSYAKVYEQKVETTAGKAGASIQKNELIDQIVQKAKVIVDEHKSEMVMDLKPDNLGKLLLKVTTERGIIIARFLVEDRQVKEALEANMQLLKDSLAEKGLNIQDVSVSVGQDADGSGRNAWEKPEYYQVRRYTYDDMPAAVTEKTSIEPRNPVMSVYDWGNSSINFTA